MRLNESSEGLGTRLKVLHSSPHVVVVCSVRNNAVAGAVSCPYLGCHGYMSCYERNRLALLGNSSSLTTTQMSSYRAAVPSNSQCYVLASFLDRASWDSGRTLHIQTIMP